MAFTQLDTESQTLDLTSEQTVLTHTPSTTDITLCRAMVLLGTGANNLDGSGGNFEITVEVDGIAWLGGAVIEELGTDTTAMIQTDEFVVPANQAVVIKVLSPNAGDSSVDVDAYLYNEEDIAPYAKIAAAESQN